MLTRSSWLHMRIPFSYFLLPVYLFSLGSSPNLNKGSMLWVFIILHIFIYPASNGYNSYFDKDEQSIGGLKNPPPVKKNLYYLALMFDAVAILLAIWKVSTVFAILIFIYGLVSKAYSHPSIRLKKYPLAGWLTIGFFQGFFTFIACYIGLNSFTLESALHLPVLIPAGLSTLLLLGSYPMTQVYQHEEDARRNDTTLSLKLGVNGTFIFTAIVFTMAAGGFFYYFIEFYSSIYGWVFLLCLAPVLTYFLFWYLRMVKDKAKADHAHTMVLNFISATCLNLFFIYFFLDNSQALQAIRSGY